eukprot:jgi/Ulvmu1/9685/UM055_0023.1
MYISGRSLSVVVLLLASLRFTDVAFAAEDCPTILPLRANTTSVAVCFPSDAALETYRELCSRAPASGSTCLSIEDTSVAPAKEQLEQLPTCTHHQYSLTDGSSGILTAALSAASCDTVTTPVPAFPDPPSLQQYEVHSDPASDRAQLSLHFSQPVSAVARPAWSLNNGKVLYTEAHNHSVHLGVQFLDLQRPAKLTIPQGSLYSAISSRVSAATITVEFSPHLPTAIAASVNSAAALTALLGTATPLRIARSILHSQFLSWTGSLAVPALPPLYRQMARSLRWKQLLLQALKSVFVAAPAEAANAAGDAAAAAGSAADSAVSGALNTTAASAVADVICDESCRLCSTSETWLSPVVIGMLCAVAALHAGLCALVRAVRGSAAPAWASGVLAGGKFEAGVALVVLPGLVFTDASNRGCSPVPLALSLAASALLFFPAAADDILAAARAVPHAAMRTARACGALCAGRGSLVAPQPPRRSTTLSLWRPSRASSYATTVPALSDGDDSADGHPVHVFAEFTEAVTLQAAERDSGRAGLAPAPEAMGQSVGAQGGTMRDGPAVSRDPASDEVPLLAAGGRAVGEGDEAVSARRLQAYGGRSGARRASMQRVRKRQSGRVTAASQKMGGEEGSMGGQQAAQHDSVRTPPRRPSDRHSIATEDVDKPNPDVDKQNPDTEIVSCAASPAHRAEYQSDQIGLLLDSPEQRPQVPPAAAPGSAEQSPRARVQRQHTPSAAVAEAATWDALDAEEEALVYTDSARREARRSVHVAPLRHDDVGSDGASSAEPRPGGRQAGVRGSRMVSLMLPEGDEQVPRVAAACGGVRGAEAWGDVAPQDHAADMARRSGGGPGQRQKAERAVAAGLACERAGSKVATGGMAGWVNDMKEAMKVDTEPQPAQRRRSGSALGAIWQSGQWLFGTSVALALCFGLFANERSSVAQVALVTAIKAAHLAALWAVLPVRSVGWQACIVDVEEAALLCLAGALLAHGAAAPPWVADATVWMFPVIIGTMLVGDAAALGWKGVRAAGRGVRAAGRAVRAACRHVLLRRQRG